MSDNIAEELKRALDAPPTYYIYVIYVESDGLRHVLHPNGKIVWLRSPLADGEKWLMYVGQTMKKPKVRFGTHLWNASNVNYTESQKLYGPLGEAIAAGKKIVQLILEDGLTDETVDDAEIGWIRELQSFEHGLNSDKGGRWVEGTHTGVDHPNAAAIRWYSKTMGEFECGCMDILATFLDANAGSIGKAARKIHRQAWSVRFQEWIQIKYQTDLSNFDSKLELPPNEPKSITVWDIDAKKIDNKFPSIAAAADYYDITSGNIMKVLGHKLRCKQFNALGCRFDAQRDGDVQRPWNDPPVRHDASPLALIAFDQDDNDDEYVLRFDSGEAAVKAGYLGANLSARHTRIYAGKWNGKDLRWEYEDLEKRSSVLERVFPMAVHYKNADGNSIPFRYLNDAAKATSTLTTQANAIRNSIETGKPCRSGHVWYKGRS